MIDTAEEFEAKAKLVCGSLAKFCKIYITKGNHTSALATAYKIRCKKYSISPLLQKTLNDLYWHKQLETQNTNKKFYTKKDLLKEREQENIKSQNKQAKNERIKSKIFIKKDY